MRTMVVMLAVMFAAAAVAASNTSAAAPTGFWTNTKLAPAVSFVAGKPVTVDCAYRQATIDATVSPTARNTAGATPVIGGNVIYLSPLTCAYLTAWQHGKQVRLYSFAIALETLAHEGELARGVADETSATCLGIPKIPHLVAKWFPLQKRESLHDLMGDVHDVWMSQSVVYHAHPC